MTLTPSADESASEVPPGPDLQSGIPIQDLPDGGMIAGRVGNDAVLLTRRGDEFFALDAHCTHYHAPLADGLIVGDTIRCPWHHACFDVRTGSAVAAPAMQPLRVFTTVRDGDLIRVRANPRTVDPPAAATVTGREHVVIIGGGAAGSFAAAELRRLGFGGRVTLLTRESRLPYDKPNLSKDYLAGRAPQEWIPLRSKTAYASARINLRLRTTVDRIDPRRSEVRLTTGERIVYDRLILATGATPRRLDVPVDEDARVHYLRTWSDAEKLKVAAGAAKTAVVIGTGFIGLEAAASLREIGLTVTVVGRDEVPLEGVLGRELGEFVRQTHEGHGVRFRNGRTPVQIRPDGVLLDDRSLEPADLVVVGIGVEPDTSLTVMAGLSIDRGILVSETLQTSVAHIYAAGDAVRFPDARTGSSIRVEHWAVAGRQGQVAARNAMGLQERYTSVPFFWSQHYDLVLAYVGHAERADDVELFGSLSQRNAAAVYRQEGRIVAVATLFRDDVSLAVEAALESNASDHVTLGIVHQAFSQAAAG